MLFLFLLPSLLSCGSDGSKFTCSPSFVTPPFIPSPFSGEGFSWPLNCGFLWGLGENLFRDNRLNLLNFVAGCSDTKASLLSRSVGGVEGANGLLGMLTSLLGLRRFSCEPDAPAMSPPPVSSSECCVWSVCMCVRERRYGWHANIHMRENSNKNPLNTYTNKLHKHTLSHTPHTRSLTYQVYITAGLVLTSFNTVPSPLTLHTITFLTHSLTHTSLTQPHTHTHTHTHTPHSLPLTQAELIIRI